MVRRIGACFAEHRKATERRTARSQNVDYRIRTCHTISDGKHILHSSRIRRTMRGDLTD